MTINKRAGAVGAALGCAILLAACDEAETPVTGWAPATGGFVGALRSTGQMVATDDRCTFSFIFNGFTKSRTPGEAKKAIGPDDPFVEIITLNAPPHLDGKAINVEVRGSYGGDRGKIGSVSIDYGDARSSDDFAVDAPSGTGAVDLRLAGKAVTGANEIKVTLALAPASVVAQQMLTLDSMEVSVAEDVDCPK